VGSPGGRLSCRQHDIREAQPGQFGQAHPGLQVQLDDGSVTDVVSDDRQEPAVLPLRQVPQLPVDSLRWQEVLRRVAGAVAVFLQEAEEGADGRHLAPAGGAGQSLLLEVAEIALQVPQPHRLHGRDPAPGLQVLAELANVDLVVALGLHSEATADQPVLQEPLLCLRERR
jgi:hypothetical protein